MGKPLSYTLKPLRHIGQSTGGDPGLADFDGEGYSNADEIALVVNGEPFDYYNQGGTTIIPVLKLISGEEQHAKIGQSIENQGSA